MAISKKVQYTAKARVKTVKGVKIVTLCIRHEGIGWYLYADEHFWAGPFDFPDQGADVAHWNSYPLPEAIGAEDPRASLDLSDDIGDWRKIS